MSKTRRDFSPEFKSQIILQLLKEEFTVNELAAKHDISPVVIGRWKSEFLENASLVFQKGPSESEIALFTTSVLTLLVSVSLPDAKTS